jgi:hypothetical protein
MTAGIQILPQESQCTNIEYTQLSPSHRISSPGGRKVKGKTPAPPPKRCSSVYTYETASAGNHYAWRAQGFGFTGPRSMAYVYAQTRTGWCSLSLHPSSPPTTIPSLPSRYLGNTRRTPRFAILSNTATAIARLWSSPVPSQGSHPSWSPSTSHTDRVRQPEAYPQIMELDIIMQIVFGVFTISIAVFGIWFAWHSTRGMSLHFQLGFYPNAPPDRSIANTPC